MIAKIRNSLALVLSVSTLLVCYACAQSGGISETGNIDWREFEAIINGKHLSFRFPVDVRPTTRLEFDPAPGVDRFTRVIGIIGMQVGLDIGWRNVTSVYSISLGLTPVQSPALGRAQSGQELARALETHISESGSRADGLAFKPVEREIVHAGAVESVRIRFVENYGPRLVAWDDYYTIWDESYLLHIRISYGKQLGRNLNEIARLKKLTDEIVGSLQVR